MILVAFMPPEAALLIALEIQNSTLPHSGEKRVQSPVST